MPTLRIHKENENQVHFITIAIIEWIDIFTKPKYFQILIDSFKFCQHNKGLLLYEYVVMTNHLHLIASAKEHHQLSQIISDFKKHTTREIIKLLDKDRRRYIKNLITHSFDRKKGSEQQIWQRENYPELVVNDTFLQKQINYIYNNPVKKGYVEKPEDWLYSSAKNRILGDNTIIQLNNLYSTMAP